MGKSKVTESIESNLDNSTIKILLTDGIGTGFWVGKKIIMTCAHVVEDIYINGGFVEAFWEDIPLKFRVAEMSTNLDIALLELFDESYQQKHPITFLSESFEIGDKLYGFGYSHNYKNGESLTAEIEGASKDPLLIKFKDSQIVPGFSGTPLLNMRTGGVCGVIQKTRDRDSDLGGRAVPILSILNSFKDLPTIQQESHRDETCWISLLTKKQKILLDLAPDKASFKKRVAEIYRLLHYSISSNHNFGQKTIDLFISRQVGDFTINRAICTIPGEVSIEDIEIDSYSL